VTIGRDSGSDSEPVLITEAQPSLDEQLSARRTKYLIMMSVRVVCLVLAATFYHTPWLLAIFVAGAVTLPWMAVLIANDRPPKKAFKVHWFGGHPNPGKAITSSAGDSRVIEG
jgi:membrane-associated PAP2 superfamily phosphatase